MCSNNVIQSKVIFSFFLDNTKIQNISNNTLINSKETHTKLEKTQEYV